MRNDHLKRWLRNLYYLLCALQTHNIGNVALIQERKEDIFSFIQRQCIKKPSSNFT